MIDMADTEETVDAVETTDADTTATTEKGDIEAEPEEEVTTSVDESVTTEDPVTAKLTELGVNAEMIEKIKEELGAETVKHLTVLREEDLVEIGMKVLQARELIDKLTPAEPAYDASGANAVSLDNILPQVPSEESWLMALKTGGVSKVDQSTVISAIRATLAHRAGLFDIPSILVTKMESFADTNEEQVPSEFFSLRKDMTRRSYADIFEAIEGLDGSFVTEKRKKQLLDRIDNNFWQAVLDFYSQLDSWQEAWNKGAANSGAVMNAIVSMQTGVNTMPPGIMQPPDTGVLCDSADAVADAINKVFAGTGVQIVAALAYDATKIKETLSNPRLPAMIGAANRDQMLRQLEVTVPATYPRMEQNLTRFVLAIMQVKDQPAGNEELQFFSALYMLGSQIPWDQLGDSSADGGMMTGIGGNRDNNYPNYRRDPKE